MLHAFCSLPLSCPWVSHGGTRSLMYRSFSSALALASFLKSSAALAIINAFKQSPTVVTLSSGPHCNIISEFHATFHARSQDTWTQHASKFTSIHASMNEIVHIPLRITTFQNIHSVRQVKNSVQVSFMRLSCLLDFPFLEGLWINHILGPNSILQIGTLWI